MVKEKTQEALPLEIMIKADFSYSSSLHSFLLGAPLGFPEQKCPVRVCPSVSLGHTKTELAPETR